MRKTLMMLVMMAATVAMQAQTVFHDVELNEAQGPVKKMVVNLMGMDQVINFGKDGKMEREGLSDAVYDADGFLQSAKMTIQGQSVAVSYKWKDGKVVSQSMNIMGQQMEMKRTYNDKGIAEAESVDMGGMEMKAPYEDYKFDSRGNWISRSTTMMGQTMTQTRTIEYYE